MRKRARAAAVEDRQARVFDLSLAGHTNLEIGRLVGCHRETVALDIAAETARRASERAADRASQIEKSISSFERIAAGAYARAERLEAQADAEPNPAVAACLRSIVPREYHVMLKACEQISKTLGLHAPLQVDVAVTEEVLGLRARLRTMENNMAAAARLRERELYLSGQTDVIPFDSR